MLTRKQYELLMFIHERVRESGIPDAEEFAEGLAHPPPAAEANEFFERMATRPA